MIDGLHLWPSGADEAVDAPYRRACPATIAPEDERGSERFAFTGAEIFLFVEGDARFRLRLKDVSCTGLSGLTDAPLAPGQPVLLQFEEIFMPAAQVTWVNRFLAGFKMVNPLPLTRMQRLAERHEQGAAWSPAMRAGSDLHSWWTDVDAQKEGRRTRLRGGGHRNPLAP